MAKVRCNTVPMMDAVAMAGSSGFSVFTLSIITSVMPGTASISDFRLVSCPRISAEEFGEFAAGLLGSKGMALGVGTHCAASD